MQALELGMQAHTSLPTLLRYASACSYRTTFTATGKNCARMLLIIEPRSC